jgi:hypothetical protein
MGWMDSLWPDSGNHEEYLASLLSNRIPPVTAYIQWNPSPLTPAVLLVKFVPIDHFLTI